MTAFTSAGQSRNHRAPFAADHPVAAFLIIVFVIAYPVMGLIALATHRMIPGAAVLTRFPIPADEVAGLLLTLGALLPAAVFVGGDCLGRRVANPSGTAAQPVPRRGPDGDPVRVRPLALGLAGADSHHHLGAAGPAGLPAARTARSAALRTDPPWHRQQPPRGRPRPQCAQPDAEPERCCRASARRSRVPTRRPGRPARADRVCSPSACGTSSAGRTETTSTASSTTTYACLAQTARPRHACSGPADGTDPQPNSHHIDRRSR